MTANDSDLLGQYLAHHSEKAFAELVQRHLNLVYSAALRQVRSPQLAEEVAQSVFTDLSRSVRKLKPGTILTAWLYQVTRRTAIDVVRRESRRQARERLAVEMAPMNTTDLSRRNPMQADDWTHIEPFLDEAMAALDETDRAAILLRFFENKSLREVGATLGTSDDAAQKRVSRAVERLREFFTKRGVTVSAAALVVLITANAVQAAPAGLAFAISTAAVVAGTTVAAASTIAVTKTIAMTTMQKALIPTVLAATVGFGILEARQNSGLRDHIQTLQQQQNDKLQELERERNDAADKLAGLQMENARLNQSTGELLKLRAEVGRLSKEAEAAKQRQALAQEKLPADDPTTNRPPFQTFSAKVRVNVPWDQAVITGGWKLPSGQRGIVITCPTCITRDGRYLAQPEIPGEGQLVINTKIFGLSEDSARKLGLDKFSTDDREVTSSSLLAADQYAALMKAIEQSDGTDVLAAPSVVTESGRQAQVQVTDNQTNPFGGNYALGPVVDYIPTISADGKSVDMQIVANINYPTTPPVK